MRAFIPAVILCFSLLGCSTLVPTIDSVERGEMPVNPAVLGHGELVIGASPEALWQTVADIDGWPSWMEEMTSARLNGRLEVGTSFDLKNLGMDVRSTLWLIEAYSKLGWVGSVYGVESAVIWTFHGTDTGTLVSVDESLDGFLVQLYFNSDQCKAEIGKRLAQLKRFAEGGLAKL